MNIKYALLAGSLAVFGLGACVSENHDLEQGQAVDEGRMALHVSQIEPMVTRATTPVTNFPVILYNASGTKVAEWAAVSLVPSTYTLSVGSYTVESHTPGIIEKQMNAPYYFGTADLEITKDVTTNVDVICKMQNSPITVTYDAEFLNVFTSWSITLDDGTNSAIAFTQADGTTPATIYYYFDSDVEKLTMNFRGTTSEGSTVSARRILTKNDAQEQYDGDSKYFRGGDALNFHFTPTEATSGHVTGITINATVTFVETNDVLTLEVTDDGTPDPGEDPNSGENPTPGDDTSITLNLPNDMTVSASTDKSLGDTYIKCDNGIKSIKVSIVSTSSEMIESLQDLNTNYGVDFVNGAEIVDNQSVVQLFNDLNQPLSVPSQGNIDYTFPIGNFFGLLGFLSGEHTFNMVVEDMNGTKKNGKLTLTVE